MNSQSSMRQPSGIKDSDIPACDCFGRQTPRPIPVSENIAARRSNFGRGETASLIAVTRRPRSDTQGYRPSTFHGAGAIRLLLGETLCRNEDWRAFPLAGIPGQSTARHRFRSDGVSGHTNEGHQSAGTRGKARARGRFWRTSPMASIQRRSWFPKNQRAFSSLAAMPNGCSHFNATPEHYRSCARSSSPEDYWRSKKHQAS
jgi:hypothetical protein